MSTFKKLLALTLALAMVLSVSAFAGYKADTYKDATSIDEDCEDAIELMYALKIMQGDNNGNFNPTATITRAEIAKMIYVILNYGKDDKAVNYTGAKMFSDVPAGAWFEGYVNYAATTKLVQGRGNGTFGPNDPVTCAEAAKMLLTAIGYSAEARGYTGANWDKNVLSDATIIGLLKGYNYSTTTYAPRQWVAVMFQNALEDALTYGKMSAMPNNGLLTSQVGYDVMTFGEKYYDFKVITAVAMATEKTSLYTSKAKVEDIFADDDCILFEDGDDEQYQLEDTGLTAADLGQEYKIITIDGDVVSIRNTGTSVVDESLLRDLTAKTVTGTYNNKENNKYEFTVDEFTGKLESSPYYISLGNLGATKVNAESLTANALYAQANGKTGNVPTTIKVIDTDGDGKIDYVVYTTFYYAQVTDVETSRAYGDYIKMKDATGEYVKVAKDSKLYVDDVISCEDELEEDNYVKYNWDNDNGVLNIEVLEVIEDTLDRVTASKKEVKIGGESYVASEVTPAFGDFEKLVKGNIGKTYVCAIDGDMLVVVADPDATATLDSINAQLCVVTDKTNHYYDGWTRKYAVEIMTADGETAQYIMANQDGNTDNSNSDKDNGIAYNNVHEVTEYSEMSFREQSPAYLYVFSIDDDNQIILSELAATAKGVKALDEDGDVIDGYWVGTGTNWEVSDNLYGDEIVLENIYFVLEDDELTVKTLEELEDRTAENLYWEGLYDNSSKLHSMVAGFIAVDTFAEYDDGAYLYLTDEVYAVDKYNYKFDAAFADGTTAEGLKLANSNPTEIEMYTLYKYTVRNDKYTLTRVPAEEANIELTVQHTNKLDKMVDFKINENAGAKELVEKFSGSSIYVDVPGETKLSKYDLTDCVIAVKNITLDLDRDEAKTIEVTYDIEFVSLDELKEMENIFNSYEENDDWYFSDFTYAEEKLFYVEVYRVTEECQEKLPEELPAEPTINEQEAARRAAVINNTTIEITAGTKAEMEDAIQTALRAKFEETDIAFQYGKFTVELPADLELPVSGYKTLSEVKATAHNFEASADATITIIINAK